MIMLSKYFSLSFAVVGIYINDQLVTNYNENYQSCLMLVV